MKITRLVIQNFRCIESFKLNISGSPIVNVIGSINGNTAKSNGAGKTSVFLAILQCLYNWNPKHPVIKDNYREGKYPYKITIDFTKDSNKYRLVNDRTENKHLVYENNLLIPLKTATQLKQYLESLLKVDEKLFAQLLYFNTHVLTEGNIKDLLSEKYILKVLNTNNLTAYSSYINKKIKDIRQEITIRSETLQTYATSLRDMANNDNLVSEEDCNSAKEELQRAVEDLQNLGSLKLPHDKNTLQADIIKCQALIQSIKNKNQEVTTLQSKIDSMISSKKCPYCQGEVISLDNLKEELEKKIESNKQDVATARDLRENTTIRKKENQSTETDYKHLHSSFLGLVNAKKDRYNKLIALYTAQQLSRDNYKLAQENHDKVQSQLKELTKDVNEWVFLLSIFKSGQITNYYLNTAVNNLQKHIDSFTRLTRFDILIVSSRSKLTYEFTDRKSGLPLKFVELSSGEQTRVALILMFGVLQSITNATIGNLNILVMDEILSFLDSEGVSFVNELLTSLEGKTTYIVSHASTVEGEKLYIDKKNNSVKEG